VTLPLAVRIAAARLRSSPWWTVAQLTDRLLDEASRLRELDDGERNVTSAFALSLESLSEPQQRLFGLLALHPGGDIELPAVAALGGHEPAEAERLLAGLDYAHLITQLPDDRVRLHDLLRRFAIEHVLPQIPQDEQKNAKRDLIDYALRRVFFADELIAPHRYRPPLPPSDVTAEPFTDRAAALAWLDREWPTLVTLGARATGQGLIDRCWLLPYLLHDYFFLTKLWVPWIESLLITTAVTRTFGENQALAMTLNNLGVALADRGELAMSQGALPRGAGPFPGVGRRARHHQRPFQPRMGRPLPRRAPCRGGGHDVRSGGIPACRRGSQRGDHASRYRVGRGRARPVRRRARPC